MSVYLCSDGWSVSEWLQWTNGGGDFGLDWPTSGGLFSEKELTIWNTSDPHNVHSLRKTPDTTGSAAPSSTPTSTKAKISAAPRQSSLHRATGPQLQQRVQLVKLRLFFTHSHFVWFMNFSFLFLCVCKVSVSHWPCCDSNSSFFFCLFFLWPQLSRCKPVI